MTVRTRGLLLDIDGTLVVHDRPVPGAVEALAAFRRAGLPFLLLTNTSRRSARATADRLRAGGLEVGPEAIVTPARLARRRILDSGRARAALLLTDEARADLEGLAVDEASPDWVVLGDLGSGFTFERLNEAFRWIKGGATLLALHKNPWWDRGDEGGPVLDVGAFAAALEYASGRAAEAVGKPAVAFFQLALRELGAPADAVLMVGDDLDADVAGGAAAGCRTALVLTGRSKAAPSTSPPDVVLESIADLPAWLDGAAR